ncbi:CDGSH iron-sulfur domain-containing protein [Parasalinivibrio latis]|uniref:CDGSH iron-sulfur domain-containing protein n=1 Tax=Parasalinivibrio latis TaxID=2952610 RepID=UPI0030E1E59A
MSDSHTGARIADNKPVLLKLEKNKTYYFCRCGHSANQPLCDGSHAGTEFSPTIYTADETANAAICACKQSASFPMCDGSHNRIASEDIGKQA